MKRRYYLYLHEREQYDLYYFNDVLRSHSRDFLIDFEEEAPLVAFLQAVEDGWYPHYIIVDLYDAQQVNAFLSSLQEWKGLPSMKVLVLRNRREDVLFFNNVEVYKRPIHPTDWDFLVQRILK